MPFLLHCGLSKTKKKGKTKQSKQPLETQRQKIHAIGRLSSEGRRTAQKAETERDTCAQPGWYREGIFVYREGKEQET